MLAFEIHKNGKKVCTAGVKGPGVLTAMLTWVLGDGHAHPKGYEELRLHVGGLVSRTYEHLIWLNRKLRRGDEISVRILEAPSVERPRQRKPERRAHRLDRRRHEQSERAYVRHLAKKFGWTLQKAR